MSAVEVVVFVVLGISAVLMAVIGISVVVRAYFGGRRAFRRPGP